MKAIKIIILGMLLFSTSAISAMDIDIQQLKKYAQEVYGTEDLYQSDVHISMYSEMISRLEIVELNSFPEYHKTLTQDLLINKYNPYLSLDDATNFSPTTFNPLKYRLNYGADDDVYYNISGTNYFIVVHPNK